MIYILWLRSERANTETFMGVFSSVKLAEMAGKSLVDTPEYSEYYWWISISQMDKLKGDM